MAVITLSVDAREVLGKKVRALRRVGITPIHVYGLSKPSRALQSAEKDILKTVQKSGKTRIVEIAVGGEDERESCLVRDIDIHPVTGKVLHVDFLRVAKDKMVEVEVPVKLVNSDNAPVTRSGDVNIMLVLSKIWIKALPEDVPQALEIDCTKLENVTDTVKAGDLKLPKNSKLSGNPDLRVISLQMTRAARASQT